MKEKIKKTLGFTMIEVLVVLAITGILATAAGANYITSLKQGRDGRRKADLEQIRSALEMYRADKGFYPPDYPPPWYGVGWCTVLWGCNWGCDSGTWYDDVMGALISEGYLSSALHDPKYKCTNKDYFYYKTGRNQYELFSSLEMDKNAADDHNPWSGGVCACETQLYQYKVTNP